MTQCSTQLRMGSAWFLCVHVLIGAIAVPCSAQSTDVKNAGDRESAFDVSVSVEAPVQVFVRQEISLSGQQSKWNPTPVLKRSGRIVQWDQETLVIRVDNSKDAREPLSLRIDSRQIERIEPNWGNQQVRQVVELFSQQKYREFIQGLRELELSEIPDWQQRLLLDWIVQAVAEVNGPLAAAPYFLKLSANAPDLLFANMPLCWTVQEPSPDLIRAAEGWMQSDDEAAQLLGASWLAQTAQSEQSREVLERLQGSKRSVISQLATAQAWRQVAPADTMECLPKWLVFRDKMLLPLGLGPTEFMLDRLSRIGQFNLALGQAFWIATTQRDWPGRAGKALDRAVELLKGQGRTEEAQKLIQWRDGQRELDR